MQKLETKLLDGKFAREKLSDKLKKEVGKLNFVPTLSIILIGNDPASLLYVKNKRLFGEKLGCRVNVETFPEKVSQEEVEDFIKKLNQDKGIHGIIVQSPVSEHLSFDDLVEKVFPEKDVDGLGTRSPFIPATARGILELLDFYEIPLEGKEVAVFGRSRLVGAPTAEEFKKRGADVNVIHSKTVKPEEISRKADIVVVATGRQEFFGREYFSLGQVVVDVGIHKKGEGFVGDIRQEEIIGLASRLSPVPGGVGPMTVLSLFKNLLEASEL